MEKEVTYEEWKKNPTPREMWVWDEGDEKVKGFVIYMQPKEKFTFNVIALEDSNSNAAFGYEHCAEIADETEKRMTNREFSWWLRGGHFREYKIQCTSSPVIRSTFDYCEGTENEEVCGDIYVRENGRRWVEPLKSLLSD